MSQRISVLTNTGRYVSLYVFDCANCGVIYALHQEYDQRRRDDGKSFYCPNGHSQAYSETAADRAKKEAERLRAQLISEMDQRQAAEDDAAAAKASEVRLRWRVGNGVCPCCSRTFPGLAAHVASKHPEFLTNDLDRHSRRQIEALAALRQATDENDSAVIDSDAYDWRTVRALIRRGLVEEIGVGYLALTEGGWPLAEQAAQVLGATR
jgi:predicted DCC family thiol-disulfide oxidoreductase YuxK